MTAEDVRQLSLSFLVLAPFAAAYVYGDQWEKSRLLRRLDPSHSGAAGANIAFFATGFLVLLIAIIATR